MHSFNGNITLNKTLQLPFIVKEICPSFSTIVWYFSKSCLILVKLKYTCTISFKSYYIRFWYLEPLICDHIIYVIILYPVCDKQQLCGILHHKKIICNISHGLYWNLLDLHMVTSSNDKQSRWYIIIGDPV